MSTDVNVGLLELRVASYDHEDATALTAAVQAEYVRRYGGGNGDASPVSPEEFTHPNGLFVVGYVNDVPMAMGGWRWGGPHVGDAEIKRMYVADTYRGHGYSRQLLQALEESARSRGVTRLVLETGTAQPEALSLYASAGYQSITKFGYYAEYDDSVHLGKMLDAPDTEARD